MRRRWDTETIPGVRAPSRVVIADDGELGEISHECFVHEP